MKAEEKKEVSTIEKKAIFNPEKDFLFMYSQELGRMRQVDARDVIEACKEKIKNLAPEVVKIGGRNLVLKSAVPKGSSEYLTAQYILSEAWIPGETYTVQIKGTVQDKGYFRAFTDVGGVSLANLTLNEKTGIWSGTGVSSEKSIGKRLSIYNTPPKNSTAQRDAAIEWVKLERGNIVTDRSIAPEDIEDRLAALEKKVK